MKKCAWLLLILALGGCKRNPVDRLVGAINEGAVPEISGIYTIFDDELKTGGRLGLIPGGQNQSINLSWIDGTRPGRHIRYAWNGQNVSSTTAPQHLFAGFELLVTPDFTGFDEADGKDLSEGMYSNLVFSVRGELSANTTLRIEGPDDGVGGNDPAQIDFPADHVLTENWQEVTLPIPNPAHFGNVKAFIIVTFQYAQPSRTTAPGGGGVVYLDDIRYE